jgi:signal transduction histidine kinase
MTMLPPSKLKHSSYFIFIFVLIPLFIASIGLGFLQLQRQTLIKEKRGDLATIADLKVASILQWRKERIVEANSIHNNGMMSRQISEFVSGRPNPNFLEEFRVWAANLTDISGYRRIMLLRPDGRLLASYSEENASFSRDYSEMIKGVLKEELIVLTDLHLDETTQQISLNLLIPIISSLKGDIKIVAVMVMEIDPYHDLFPIVESWPAASKSAETLLVRQDGNDILYLNELRFLKNAAMKYRRPMSQAALPAGKAVRGEEGEFEGIDYRGVSVQSATRLIPGSNWSMVSKIDTREAVEPMSTHIWYVGSACLMLITTIMFGVSLWWKKREKETLQAQYESELELNTELSNARTELQQAHNELENRVLERTSQLQASKNLLNNLSSQVPGLLFQFQLYSDGSYRFPFISDAVNSFSGFSAEEVINNPDKLFNMVHLDDYQGLMHAIRESARTLLPWHHECRVINKKKGISWRSIIAQPKQLEDGSVLWHGFISDITENKLLSNELFEAKKLESIGQIAGGVAHEVRNPLNAILSITEALFREREIEGNPELVPYVQHIRTQVGRLANLMNDLLELGKGIPAANIVSVSLHQLCCDTISLWMASGSTEKMQITFVSNQEHHELLVKADSIKFQQVLFNLIENAAQHSPEGSRIFLEICGTEFLESGVEVAMLKIIDEGSGIRVDKIDRVFDPFYSDRKGGTGLGLALVKHFMENMGGTVMLANNAPRPGCTAEVRIPVAGMGS